MKASPPSLPAPPAPVRRGRLFEILLSYACNAKCGFCYNPPLTEEVLKYEISLPRALALMKRARAEGCEGVWLTGGEPTLRKDLPQLLLAAKKLGFSRIQIGTNGHRLGDERYARRLAAAGLNFARISLHAASPAAHDELLGIPGCYSAALRAVEHLARLGVETGVNFVVTRRNYRELPAFFRLCARLKLPHFDVIFLHHRGTMELHAEELGVRYAQVAPHLRRAFRALRAAAPSPPVPRLVNVPPCVAPELEPWIVDWAAHDDGDKLAHPSNGEIDLNAMKRAQRVKAHGCSSCALDSRCMGFEVEYARLYGHSDFRPIAARERR